MDPNSQPSPQNQPATAPSSILSDEEIRTRAAAFAQQIYEQQLEAYRIQRERLVAAQQARQEYERQWQAYEQACRDFQAQQSAQPMLRINPATGEQVYAQPNDDDGAVDDENVAQTAEAQDPGVEEGEPVSPEGIEESVDSDVLVAEEDSEACEEQVAEDEFSSEVVASEDDALKEEVEPESEALEPSAASEPAEPSKKMPAPSGSGFSPVSMLLVVVCVAVLSATGYILFSDDPRFEQQRTRFFSLFQSEGENHAELVSSPENDGVSISAAREEFDIAEDELSAMDEDDEPSEAEPSVIYEDEDAEVSEEAEEDDIFLD